MANIANDKLYLVPLQKANLKHDFFYICSLNCIYCWDLWDCSAPSQAQARPPVQDQIVSDVILKQGPDETDLLCSWRPMVLHQPL